MGIKSSTTVLSYNEYAKTPCTLMLISTGLGTRYVVVLMLNASKERDTRFPSEPNSSHVSFQGPE